MENKLVVLPPEVKEIAVKVSEEKQHEVNEILTQIFNGTADWEKQVDAIKVKDVNDIMSINMAEAARRNAKAARLHGEKRFDSKRSEVQERMSDDKLEDSLWLKSKQIMQLKFKHIEEKAAYKADFVKRFNLEQKELKTEQRLNKVVKFNPEITKLEVENMTDETFDIYLSGIEKNYNDRIAAEKKAEEERIEAERINKLHFLRYNELSKYQDFSANIVDLNGCEFGKLTDVGYLKIKTKLIKAKEDSEKEQIEIKKEKERLEKEVQEKARIEKELKLIREKRNEELKPYIIFIRDYDNLLNKSESEYKKELAGIKKGAELHWESEKQKAKEQALKEQKDREEKEKLQAKLKAKEDSELKEKQRVLDERFAQEKAEKAASLAPDKDKLLSLSKRIIDTPLPQLSNKEAQKILDEVTQLLFKIDTYIKEKAELL